MRRLFVKPESSETAALCCWREPHQFGGIPRGKHTCWGIFVQDPPIAQANSKFVLNLDTWFHVDRLGEDMFACVVNGKGHFLGFPGRIGEGPGDEDGRFSAGLPVSDGDRNL